MAAEGGHAPNRAYMAQDGSLHLNGASVYDSNENNIADDLDHINTLGDELDLLSGVTATAAEINTSSGTTARKSWTAAPAGAGTNQGNGTALTADFNAVTGADGTVGVVLPTATATSVIHVVNTGTAILKVYPATGAQINALGANAAISLAPGVHAIFVGRSATLWYCAAITTLLATGGVAAGYKIARGTHTQVAQSDTIVTGLATVVSVVVSFQSAPTAKQAFPAGDPGNQSGAPAAGSFLLKTYKSTFAVADDFTDNLVFAWEAVGT